jgi:hypothetical protein
MSAPCLGTRPPALLGRAPRALLWVLAGALAMPGCDDGMSPDGLPFGRTGEVRIQVHTPLLIGDAPVGALEQILSWHSNGTWRLAEQIYYKNGLGDETVRRSTEDAGTLAQRYAEWITRVNAPGGAVQLVELLDADLVPTCPLQSQSVVTVSIIDAQRADSTGWSRCGDGSLATLEADPFAKDFGADRVVEAAKLLRNATLVLDREFVKKGYAYTGSRPFKTIERGEQTKAPLLSPRVIEDAATLAGFWTQYIGNGAPPAVDFGTEVVLVGAVGTRQEAGDSVEIRRVLQVEFGTQIILWERRPGNFCTPAPRVHAPFHIVVAPIAITTRPIFFEVQQQPDFVPCG